MNERITADTIEAQIKAEVEATKTTCDHCGARFIIDLIPAPTADGGEYQSFTCPDCGEEYPVATITAHGVRLRGEIERFAKMENVDASLGYVECRKAIRDLRKQFAREVRMRQRPIDPGYHSLDCTCDSDPLGRCVIPSHKREGE